MLTELAGYQPALLLLFLVMVQGLSGQQAFCVRGRNPSALFRDPDGNELVFLLIDCVENRCGRKQRDFVLAAPAAEENADSGFFRHG